MADGSGRLELVESGPPVVFQVVGHVNGMDAELMAVELEQALAQFAPARIILDMSRSDFVGAAGLRMLITATRLAKDRFVVAAPPEHLRRMLSLSGLDRALTVAATVEEARQQAM